MALHLPDEIIDHILSLACTLPPLKQASHRDPPADEAEKLSVQCSAPRLDIPTTLKLLRLSPQHYPFIASILYKGPRLCDPISLSLFARTLTLRPALGRLVKHLWVGHTYPGEKLPVNALNFGLGGCEAAYALSSTIATIGDVKACLARGVPPSNLLSPAFEKRIAQWVAFHVHGNSRIIDPLRAPRGIHIDAPGSGDPDSRGYHWIGVDEWMLRLWDGRDLVIELREVAQRAWWLELQRLERRRGLTTASPGQQQSSSATSGGSAVPGSSMLQGDLVDPFRPKDLAERRPGTEEDPLDWADADAPPKAESDPQQRPSIASWSDDQPVYSESTDLDEIDSERDRCFAEMGVKKPAWSSQSWSEVATVGDQKIEWWLVWLIAKSRARGRIVARRVWQAEQQDDPDHRGWKPVLPPPSLNTKNHFSHPTLFARSGASHLLVGGAPPSERNDVWNGGRATDEEGFSTSDSDSDSDSELDFGSDDSQYESDLDDEAAEQRSSGSRVDMPLAQRAQHRPQRSGRRLSQALPRFNESELQKSEDQADLWGGGNNFTNGNERAGAGNSVMGSRGGMFGYGSPLRSGALDEPEDGLDDGTGFSALLRRRARVRNDQDRLLSEMTLGSVLSSMRIVLTLAPKLRNLALDGVFERAVSGRRPMGGMGKLKTLSLGPPPTYWSSSLLFGHPVHASKRQRLLHHHERMDRESRGRNNDEGQPSRSLFPVPGVLIPSPCFATLRTLHISGCMLFPGEARAIGGLGGQLPNLRHFRWSLWQPHVEGHPVGVVETLCTVMDIPTLEEEAALTKSSSSTTSGGRDAAGDSDARKRRKQHDGTFRRRAGPSHLPIQDLSLTPSSAAHAASLSSLLTRKRKLRSVYATLHPIDEAILSRKAPPRLLYDSRLVIETAKNENVADNLREMTRWWEWESGMMGFEPTLKNLAKVERQAAAAAAAAAAVVDAETTDAVDLARRETEPLDAAGEGTERNEMRDEAVGEGYPIVITTLP